MVLDSRGSIEISSVASRQGNKSTADRRPDEARIAIFPDVSTS